MTYEVKVFGTVLGASSAMQFKGDDEFAFYDFVPNERFRHIFGPTQMLTINHVTGLVRTHTDCGDIKNERKLELALTSI